MLRSSNFNSIIDEVGESFANAAAGYNNSSKNDDNANITDMENAAMLSNSTLSDVELTDSTATTSPTYSDQKSVIAQSTSSSSTLVAHNASTTTTTTTTNSTTSIDASNAAVYLAMGFMEIFEPPLVRVRSQLKELIGKQNKIYIDLSAEKYKLDNSEMTRLNDMMNNVRIYREKLLKIRKRMQSIYQRMKTLKKRTVNIETCKQKELQRKLQKQQQEEALIGKQ